MNILVLNGSPKGEESVTLQTVRYLEKRYGVTTAVLHVGQRIGKIEKNFDEAKDALERADLLLFCYPVYTFLAPSQLHRFVELIRENGVCLSAPLHPRRLRRPRAEVSVRALAGHGGSFKARRPQGGGSVLRAFALADGDRRICASVLSRFTGASAVRSRAARGGFGGAESPAQRRNHHHTGGAARLEEFLWAKP